MRVWLQTPWRVCQKAVDSFMVIKKCDELLCWAPDRADAIRNM